MMQRYIARKEVTRHAIPWIAGEQIEYNEHYNVPCLDYFRVPIRLRANEDNIEQNKNQFHL